MKKSKSTKIKTINSILKKDDSISKNNLEGIDYFLVNKEVLRLYNNNIKKIILEVPFSTESLNNLFISLKNKGVTKLYSGYMGNYNIEDIEDILVTKIGYDENRGTIATFMRHQIRGFCTSHLQKQKKLYKYKAHKITSLDDIYENIILDEYIKIDFSLPLEDSIDTNYFDRKLNISKIKNTKFTGIDKGILSKDLIFVFLFCYLNNLNFKLFYNTYIQSVDACLYLLFSISRKLKIGNIYKLRKIADKTYAQVMDKDFEQEYPKLIKSLLKDKFYDGFSKFSLAQLRENNKIIVIEGNKELLNNISDNKLLSLDSIFDDRGFKLIRTSDYYINKRSL